MGRVKRALFGVGVVLVALVVVVLVGTFSGASRQITAAPGPALEVSREAALDRLAEAVRHRTVTTHEGYDASTFVALHAFLARAFPRVHEVLHLRKVAGHSLLYTWTGSDPDLKPALLLAHQDVVPVANLDRWTHPPFDGRREGGFVWGRGTLDDKGSVVAILEAIEALLTAGYEPRRTVILAFGHDEEIGGQGAKAMAEVLAKRDVKAEYVLDEGGPIALGIVPGVDRPVALIGVAEKGYVTVHLSAKAKGGHSSMPPPLTAVGRVARAVARLEADPFPMSITAGPAYQMDWLAPELPFVQRMALQNRWLFAPLVKSLYAKKPSTAASLRTTTAPTIFHGGQKENVLPKAAGASVNFRVLTGETPDGVVARVERVVDDPEVVVQRGPFVSHPSPVSDPDTTAFARVQKTIAQVSPDVIVVPFLTVGAMDARHYVGLSPNVYRFFPLRLDSAGLERIHGTDERIAEDNYLEMVRFYAQLIRNGDPTP